MNDVIEEIRAAIASLRKFNVTLQSFDHARGLSRAAALKLIRLTEMLQTHSTKRYWVEIDANTISPVKSAAAIKLLTELGTELFVFKNHALYAMTE